MRPPFRGHVGSQGGGNFTPQRGNLTPDWEFHLIQPPMRHQCHVRKFVRAVVRPPGQRSCHVITGMCPSLLWPPRRQICHVLMGICPNLVWTPSRRRCWVRGFVQTCSAVQTAETPCTWLFPSPVASVSCVITYGICANMRCCMHSFL